VTFVPQTRQDSGMSPVVRTLLFWVLMMMLAVVMWRMASNSSKEKPAEGMTYSDFLTQVDKNNVGAAHLYESRDTAEIIGQLRQPPDKFRVTVPKETIPDLTERLSKQGAAVEVSNSAESNRLNTALNVLVFVMLIAVWIFMMRRRQALRNKSAPPGQSPPLDVSNRPLG
jgi:ATP-dependent Zn protease